MTHESAERSNRVCVAGEPAAAAAIAELAPMLREALPMLREFITSRNGGTAADSGELYLKPGEAGRLLVLRGCTERDRRWQYSKILKAQSWIRRRKIGRAWHVNADDWLAYTRSLEKASDMKGDCRDAMERSLKHGASVAHRSADS